MRTVQRSLRLDEDESARLDALAEKLGLDWPAVVRMLIKKEWDRVTKKETSKFDDEPSRGRHVP